MCGFLGLALEAEAILIRHDRTTNDYKHLYVLPELQSVVRLRTSFGTNPLTPTVYTSSAVHIGHGFLLTAGHVVQGNGQPLLSMTAYSLDGMIFSIDSSRTRVNSGFSHTNYDATVGNDIAVISLDGDWQNTYMPGYTLAAATSWVGGALTGGELVVGGYGQRGTGLEPGTSGSGIWRAGMNTLDDASADGRVGFFDFDSPSTAITNLGSTVPLNLEAMINPGDSGGGWFMNDGGALRLTHISSGIKGNLDDIGDGSYGDLAMGVNISSHWDWINAASADIWGNGNSPLFNAAGGPIGKVEGLTGYVSYYDPIYIRLTWQPAARASSYKVYRDNVLVGTLSGTNYGPDYYSPSVPSWSGPVPSWDTAYSFRVVAANISGDGPLSEEFTLRTPAEIDAKPHALIVRTPAAQTVHSTTNFLYTGNAGAAFTGSIVWSNALSGQTASFAAARDWYVSVPLAIGTNVVTFRAVDTNAMTVTTTAPAVIVTGDSDADGMPDWWEESHFGHPTLAMPDEDSDADRFSNLWEFRLGTLPRDAGSRFEVVAMQNGTGSMTVQWKSSPGKTYRLMASTNIVTPTWTQVGAAVNATTNTASQIHTVPADAKQFFYRVEFGGDTAPTADASNDASNANEEPASMLPTMVAEEIGDAVVTPDIVEEAASPRAPAELLNQATSEIHDDVAGEASVLPAPDLASVPLETNPPASIASARVIHGAGSTVAPEQSMPAILDSEPWIPPVDVSAPDAPRQLSEPPLSLSPALVATGVSASRQKMVGSYVAPSAGLDAAADFTNRAVTTELKSSGVAPLGKEQPAWLVLPELWQLFLAWLKSWFGVS